MKLIRCFLLLVICYSLLLLAGCIAVLPSVAADAAETEPQSSSVQSNTEEEKTEETMASTTSITETAMMSTTNVTYARLYADDAGESHVEDATIDLALADMAPPAPPLYLSAFTPASQFAYVEVPAGWDGTQHPAPLRAAWFILSGELEIIMSDGEARRFPAGSSFVAEDTTGKGHITRAIGDSEVRLVVVALAE